MISLVYTQSTQSLPSTLGMAITNYQIIIHSRSCRDHSEAPADFFFSQLLPHCSEPKPSQEKKMAATMATACTVVGLGSSSLSSPSRISSSKRSMSTLSSGFLRSPVRARNPLVQANASRGRFTCFERDWLRTDLNVIGFGLIGWLAPSSIPAINGNSLTGLFFQSIAAELSHFPTGPALSSPFWLWMVTWHLGLFLCLTFGQIGFKGRTEDYFNN